MNLSKSTLAVLLCLTPLMPVQHAEADIGGVAAVNNRMDGTSTVFQRRALVISDPVLQNERIETTESGLGQLLFLDQTSLTVAPKSDLVLDKYVFDPDGEQGQILFTMTRGAARLIGGRITKKTEGVFRSPIATVGVRGGMIAVLVDDDDTTTVVLLAGEYAKVSDNYGKTVFLSRSNAMAKITREGGVAFAGLISKEFLDEIYRMFEGTGNGGTSAVADPATLTAGIELIAGVNSSEKGGEEREPISTSGEAPVGGNAERPDGSSPETRPGPSAGIPVSQQPPGSQQPPVVTPPPTGGALPSGGSFFASLTGFLGFDTVLQGSLIGQNSGNTIVRIPVPETDGAVFTTEIAGQTLEPYFATTLAEQDGLFGQTGFFDFSAGASSPELEKFGTLDALDGVGFSDLENAFHIYQFDASFSDPQIEDQFGQVLFGPASALQAAEGPGDSTTPRTANTVGHYRIEPNIRSGGGADLPGDVLHVIANGAEPRFVRSDGQTAGTEAHGGRVLAGQAGVSTAGPGDGTTSQSSFFSVFAQPVAQTAAGLIFSGPAISTSASEGATKIAFQNFGTLENIAGNTVFGEDENYIVVSSLFRPDGDPDADYVFDPGISRTLGSSADVPLNPAQNLLTRDPAGDAVVSDPFRIAGPDAAQAGEDLTLSGFAAGITQCSDGQCGRSIGGSDPTGFFAQRTKRSIVGLSEITFDAGETGTDTNALALRLRTKADDLSGLPGSSPERASFFSFETDGTSGAYLDDRVFGAAGGADATISGLEGVSADAMLASTGLVGDAGLLSDDAQVSEYLRWGFWSVRYDVDADREDIVHMGTWVAGIVPETEQLPSDLTARYTGFVTASDAGPLHANPVLHGGSFALDYDFGTAKGTLDLNVADYAFQDVPATGARFDRRFYDFGATADRARLAGEGGFFASPDNPVAATAGAFTIFDGKRQLTGTYGGTQ